MASRRIKSTIQNKYTQPLKLRTGRSLVITPTCDYNSILFTKKHKAPSESEYVQTVWAKYDSENFDGIQLLAYLERSYTDMAIASGVFSVYLVSTDTTWTETLITDVVGTLDGTRLTAELPQSLLGVIELDGEFTLAVKCTITRQGTNYTKKIYLNHLGVYESIFRLRQKVAFLDITKKDE